MSKFYLNVCTFERRKKAFSHSMFKNKTFSSLACYFLISSVSISISILSSRMLVSIPEVFLFFFFFFLVVAPAVLWTPDDYIMFISAIKLSPDFFMRSIFFCFSLSILFSRVSWSSSSTAVNESNKIDKNRFRSM